MGSENLMAIRLVERAADAMMLLVCLMLAILSMGNHCQLERVLIPNSLPRTAYFVDSIIKSMHAQNTTDNEMPSHKSVPVNMGPAMQQSYKKRDSQQSANLFFQERGLII